MSDVGTVKLPGDVRMPVVGFGTWQITGRQGYQAVRYALDVGYRHLDTATIYGNEAEVGRAVRDSGIARPEVFITTKLPPERAGRGRRTLTDSLHALDTEYVDLWLVHWPPRGPASVQAWRELLAAAEDGLARAVGVSNYSTTQIDELVALTGTAPAVNQIPWSPWDHDPDTLADSAARGVVVEGYSPLKRSKLEHPVLREVADAHGVTPAQVVLRWHLEHDIVVIPKSAREDRMRSNLDILGFSLTTDEIAKIDGLAAG